MPLSISVEPFSVEKLPAVQSFDCTSDPAQPWETKVNDYLKGSPESYSAAQDLAKFQTSLYYSDSGALIGFATLGQQEWSFPKPYRKRMKCSLLRAFGIDRHFQRLPSGVPRQERYAWEVMRDVQSRAEETGNRALALFVDKQNEKAIAFYRAYGFALIEEDRENYYRMILNISPEPLVAAT
jgi:hypothetical protein